MQQSFKNYSPGMSGWNYRLVQIVPIDGERLGQRLFTFTFSCSGPMGPFLSGGARGAERAEPRWESLFGVHLGMASISPSLVRNDWTVSGALESVCRSVVCLGGLLGDTQPGGLTRCPSHPLCGLRREA